MKRVTLILMAVVLFIGISVVKVMAQTTEYTPQVIIQGKWGTGSAEFGFTSDNKCPIAPRAIFIRDNFIYILDSSNLRIKKYTMKGEFNSNILLERIMEKKEKGYSKKVKNPTQIAPNIILGDQSEELYIDNNGNIFITGYGGVGHLRIYIFNKNGKLLHEIGEDNLKEDEYIPYSEIFAIGKNGEIYFRVNKKGNKPVKIKSKNAEQKEEIKYLPEYTKESAGYYEISFSGMGRKYKLNEIKESALFHLFSRYSLPSNPMISPKVDPKLYNLISESRNVYGLGGRTTIMENGDIYETVFVSSGIPRNLTKESLDAGFKLIKWEVK